MRQPTKGRVLKKRVWCFVEALLTRAEDSSDFEVHWETDKNTGRPNFVVKTKRRFLESLAQLKTQELTEVIKSLENLEIWDDRRLRRGKGSEIGSFALKLWSTDVQRNREQLERVWEDSRTAKSKALEATYNESKDSAEASQSEIDWREVCRTMLEKHKQLTTNRLMREDEMLFDIDRIRVDLALVERKQTDKRSEDDNPARSAESSSASLSQLYKPDYEETQKLEYEDFLSKVLKSEQSKKVAIIGEPGAGKTTLLQRIAFWILENTDDLPIWIPLGNFPNPAPKFKDYLLNDWLEDAIVGITPKIKAEFEERLAAGKVWLLLDGVDEMAAKSGSPLTAIANRIVGWCSCLRVVLTCRLNVWEANPYSLHGFQTYRTLEFSQEKVEEFIKACFQNRKGDTCVAPTLGIQLQQALNQPGKERIKDLVRNPLRLTLLCSTWHWREGKLPDTKAELYQQFVEEVYRWQDKEKEVSTITPEEREQLNAKLKELAVAAIDNETNRFCLRQKFVEGVFGDSALFQLALSVGWLNQVGVDAKNPHQPVYAFFHPTFEEYFAALAIDDWDFFLPRAHDNHNPKPVSEKYRIFESQWKEVILLWLGREEVEKEQKEEFIKALVEFDEGIEPQFYGYRAYFLAAEGIEEFVDCSIKAKLLSVMESPLGEADDEVVMQKLRAPINNYFGAIPKMVTYSITLVKQLGFKNIKIRMVADLERLTDCNALIQLLSSSQSELNHTTATISRLDNIKTLLEYLGTDQSDLIRRAAIKRLLEIASSNPTTVIATLIESLYTSCDQGIYLLAAWLLGKIALGHLETVNALIHLLRTSRDELIRMASVNSLETIVQGNLFQVVVERLKDCLTNQVRKNDPDLYMYCLKLIQRCAQNMTYPDFHQAWHQQEGVDKTTTPDRQSLNQADLPQSLQSAIANDPQLSQIIHLICIDSSKFIDPNNPAAKIYTEMVKRGCPKCNDGTPKTMAELQIYWDLLEIEFDKRIVLVFYTSSADPTSAKDTAMPCPYSETFLLDLSKFGDRICVITHQPFNHIRLKLFTPSHAIEDMKDWLQTID